MRNYWRGLYFYRFLASQIYAKIKVTAIKKFFFTVDIHTKFEHNVLDNSWFMIEEACSTDVTAQTFTFDWNGTANARIITSLTKWIEEKLHFCSSYAFIQNAIGLPIAPSVEFTCSRAYLQDLKLRNPHKNPNQISATFTKCEKKSKPEIVIC